MGSSDTFKDLNDYNIHAKNYSKLDVSGKGTLYLAFRDVPALMTPLLPEGKSFPELNCVDYGCGAGRSTRFLKSLGVEHVDGFDINKEMLTNALKFDPVGNYELIKTGRIPSPDDVYDLAFCSFVFVEIRERDVIAQIYKEIDRVLAPGGLFVVVTTTKDLYNPANQWLTYKILSDKQNIQSGEAIPLCITDIDFNLFDVYWSEEDYLNWGREAGLHLAVEHLPLGTPNDGIEWKSEATVSPYGIYIFRK